ncbi:MAG: hypothetical protein NTU83_10630 [Candidatus Hydrogenedentes bacterium]|nr:hypothetical protein [Candidatus Hydrogenedentota bacterium]
MLAQGRSNVWGIYARVAGVLVLIGAAIFAGLWLGEKSVRFEEDRPVPRVKEEAPKNKPDVPPLPPPPMYCYVHIPSGTGQNVVLEEIGMAAKAGIHQYVIDVPLPWEGDAAAFLDPIAMLRHTDPEAAMMLSVRMDPPPAWISAHPDEVVKAPGAESASVSLASEAWRREACAALEGFVTGVKAGRRTMGARWRVRYLAGERAWIPHVAPIALQGTGRAPASVGRHECDLRFRRHSRRTRHADAVSPFLGRAGHAGPRGLPALHFGNHRRGDSRIRGACQETRR